jgi:(1->4)-alpha-D-glucan 1-alpha-D-glucosylmutase
MANSLAQVVLKIASPGAPDFYQGTELWQFDLADPDNRRPVDFDRRAEMLEGLRQWLTLSAEGDGPELAGFVSGLTNSWWDGRIKMFVTAAGLRLRRRWPDLFIDGGYEPLAASGEGAEHVVAFARQHGGRIVIAAVPRLSTTLLHHVGDRRVGGIWQDIQIKLPAGAPRRYRHLFSNERIEVNDTGLCAADMFRASPVAMLVGVT